MSEPSLGYLAKVIQHLPTLSWIKNTDYRYIASSQRLIQLLGCPSEDAFYEKDDFNQPWAEYARLYRKEDEQVLTGDFLTFVHPAKLYTGQDILIITRKSPLYDENNTIQGIMGNITIATSPQLMQTISGLKKNDFELTAINRYEPGRYCIAELVPKTTLSIRECECLFYLIRGETAAEIAKRLFISKRTVEKHIVNIKHKWDCRKKSEVIEKAIELGYVSFIPKAFLNSN